MDPVTALPCAALPCPRKEEKRDEFRPKPEKEEGGLAALYDVGWERKKEKPPVDRLLQLIATVRCTRHSQDTLAYAQLYGKP